MTAGVRINGFITSLTGITNQMIRAAPAAERVMPGSFMDRVALDFRPRQRADFSNAEVDGRPAPPLSSLERDNDRPIGNRRRRNMGDLLKGHRAAVTGGASGIGAAIAAGYAREGAEVIILDHNTAAADITAEGIQIFVGQESGYQILDDCSVITAPYEVDGDVVGVLGVIGPTRMPYERVVPIVDITAKLLGAALKQKD